jgi:anti-sigma B factor antagonist
VVALPAELDIASAQRAGADLAAAIVPGAPMVIADLTTTTFCDSSGIRELAAAHRRAMANHVQMIAVVPSPAVRKVMQITGLFGMIAVCPDMATAVAAASQTGLRARGGQW